MRDKIKLIKIGSEQFSRYDALMFLPFSFL
jgi:hypothetical protein